MKTIDVSGQPEETGLTVPVNRGVSTPALNPEVLIAQAIEKGVDVGVMERLLDMRTKLRQENAKAEYDRSMAAFQADCPIIVKRKAGASNAYRYAPLDHIVEEVKGLLQKHGFSYAISSEIEQGWVKAFCRVTHTAGHSEVAEFKAPVDERNKMMTDPQRYGAAMTFAKRYAFTNAFGILTADEDTDGGHKPKPQGPSTLAGDGDVRPLVAEVWKLLAKVRGPEKNWDAANNWLWAEELLDAAADERCPNLTAPRLQKLIAALKSHPDLK